jgi:hypothetical protein
LIENYLGIYDAYEATLKLRSNEEKKLPRNYLLSTSYIILACTFSGQTPAAQYKLFRAMIDLIKETKESKKLNDDELDLIAGLLLVAAEVRRSKI